ncbi:MAG: metalloregulator ArsR/SmtB family transcription factor [Gammaproteobacteria bacterium]|nr:metalloregulator ArsR/SmtB family transcription factor [Gammaproteobacteria bacterium]
MSPYPEQFLRALNDPTRLRILVLLSENLELCVCDLTHTMDLAQPKISRHLATLREAGIVLDRREGQWIHYRIHPELPPWAFRVLDAIHDGCEGKNPYAADRNRLKDKGNRPETDCGVAKTTT